jgi:hypothetical protein
MRSLFTITILFILLTASNLFSQSGKITGHVKDIATGEPLIGVNVLLEGTNLGAATNLEGYYVILNVRPGVYSIRASMIGYAAKTITNLNVSIDQTTEANFELADQTIQTEEVIVVAVKPIIQKDVSASSININFENIEVLPVSSISSAIGLQAGIFGSEFRGGAADQTSWMLNGVSLRDERNNQSYTGISLTSVEEVQVLTGGFNAEYGEARSGIVNVVTKEGKYDRYTISFIGRYRPAGAKHFGSSPHAADSYWMRPYLDDAVAWVGTKNGTWDKYMQEQYPSFDGWDKISQIYMSDDNPANDLTPQALQKLFLFQHRKNTDIVKPDFDVDASVGGYIPYLSQRLGNLRFFASFRNIREMYLIPLATDSYTDQSFQLRFTSDIRSGMKLNLEGLYAVEEGTNSSRSGTTGIFRSSYGIANAMNNVNYVNARIFTNDYWNPTKVNRNNVAAKFTHVLNPTTFYEASLSRFESNYNTNPGRPRDLTKQYLFGNAYLVDEAPFGFYEEPSQGLGDFRMSVGFSNSRDTSIIRSYAAKFDIQSQLDQYNQLKAGVEIRYSENKANYAQYDKYLESENYRANWNAYPIKGSLYLQDKLEFEGMIANLGVRLDYSDPNMNWFIYEDFTNAFASENIGGIDTLLPKEPAKVQLNISPRLGIAFPITVSSKLFFNYGHFRQLPTPENLYFIKILQLTNQLDQLANPNNSLPKTIQYELGYEQSLLQEFLIRLSGYYKDVSEQPLTVNYVSRNGKVNYLRSEPNSYADIRGFEASLYKNRGDWIQGFVNYTYMVSTSGRFGFSVYNQNPALQRDYERITTSNYQSRPVPRPYARLNVDLFTPPDYGPDLGGFKPLGDWRLNILATWRNGFYLTWTGGGPIPGVEYNVQWKDTWNTDLRVAKNFTFNKLNFQFFVDIFNAFNFKVVDNAIGYSYDGDDYNKYMKSLHLPYESFSEFPRDERGNIKTGYTNDKEGTTYVFGSDRPGDYRKGPYIPWDDSAPESEKAKWLENKSYIDMPNQTYFTFLNPRNIYFGLRLSWEIF